MKRIAAACLMQTVVFQQKDDVEKNLAASLVKEEVVKYKSNLERRGIKFTITEESSLPDGSVTIKIIRQYNSYKTGGYLG